MKKVKYFHVFNEKQTSSNEFNYFKVILKCAQEWQRPMPKGNQWNVIFQWNAIKNSKCVNFTRNFNGAFSQKEIVISILFEYYGEWNNNQVSCDPCKEEKNFHGKIMLHRKGIALTVRLIFKNFICILLNLQVVLKLWTTHIIPFYGTIILLN